MKLGAALILSFMLFAALFVGFLALSPRHQDMNTSDIVSAPLWQRMVEPGELSVAHAFLENKCSACHTPNKGVEAKNCVVCHGDNQNLLHRQPTAFHANIAACVDCHIEHQGRVLSVTKMDHAALARIGLRQIQNSVAGRDEERDELAAWVKQNSAAPLAPQLLREESLLNCVECHQTKDKHLGLFGNDCAQCHGTLKWTIPEYRHPSLASKSCAQCHQAPPSHYMMHFQMISMTVAGVKKAEVRQCFLCHQTTVWNDIKGVGYYKHH